MLVIKDNLSIYSEYDLSKISHLEEILFFDIETTGLSPTNSALYMIGCVFCRDNQFKYIQWFADDFSSETIILKSFFEFQKNFNTLIHFNGSRFDIPYLKSCCNQYSLPYKFTYRTNIDICREILPYKKFLNMKSMRQTEIEKFLNIDRTDKYNGKELISIYKQYIKTKDKQLLQLLLLHNVCDLKGMLQITKILKYKDFFSGDFRITDTKSNFDTSSDIPFLNIIIKIDISLPKPIEITKDYSPQVVFSFISSMHIQDNKITLSIPIYQGELKYFFTEYKQYYYLPEEDIAVHKKLAQFVDKKYKKRATAATCYTKKTGLFLPIPNANNHNSIFKFDYKSKLYFIEYTDELFSDTEYLKYYLLSYFSDRYSRFAPATCL